MTRDDLLAAIRDAPHESLPEWAGACEEGRLLAESRIVQGRPAGDAEGASTGNEGNLSASEAAQRLGVSKDFLYKQAQARRLPFAKRIGRRVVFDAKGLERWDRQRSTG